MALDYMIAIATDRETSEIAELVSAICLSGAISDEEITNSSADGVTLRRGLYVDINTAHHSAFFPIDDAKRIARMVRIDPDFGANGGRGRPRRGDAREVVGYDEWIVDRVEWRGVVDRGNDLGYQRDVGRSPFELVGQQRPSPSSWVEEQALVRQTR